MRRALQHLKKSGQGRTAPPEGGLKWDGAVLTGLTEGTRMQRMQQNTGKWQSMWGLAMPHAYAVLLCS